ncbi:60 kDa lysophospholipase-like isoform X2 [Triplophysa dalaica]|uniref:60 kDa lysophospholipase-like isoform X2 n=1 Tax=Triplophysa dalaica TaxID=1582913 RepID=UPI0024DFC985|nr:60 kDa lysophospholipase-like isoform X2 [Triplophysa dalaica]
MQTPGALKIDLHKSVVLCDGPPLHMLEEVMQLNWLDIRSQQGKHILIEKTLPSFASNAVKNNDFNSLLVLLEHVDVNSGDYNGHTPLHTASELGNLDMAMFLLGKGASPEFTNSFGQRPFHLAIKNRHFRVIKLLRLRGFTVKLHPVRIAIEMIHPLCPCKGGEESRFNLSPSADSLPCTVYKHVNSSVLFFFLLCSFVNKICVLSAL